MDLLPKVFTDFSSVSYWESFFSKRVQSFEWYGNYYELCGILSRYVKAKDDILVVGCGNSTLSEHLYAAGCEKITNIDISKTVIKQMRDRNVTRLNMKWLEMDTTSLQLENGSFSVVIDKGTLDAMMSDTKKIESVDQMFDEVSRVIRIGGRYICISLAQDHVLTKMLSYFPANNWLVRVHKVWTSPPEPGEDNARLPVFAFIFTKFQALPQKILEVCLEDNINPTRLISQDAMVEFVKSQQYYAMVRNNLSNGKATPDMPPVELFSSEQVNSPRYTIFVVDLKKWNQTLKYGIFIVPQGREREWLFSSSEGRLQLAESAQFQRLAIVSLSRDHLYKDGMQGIQDELSSRVLELAPSDLPTEYKVPFLSIGNNDIGERHVVYRCQLSCDSSLVVEDYLGEGRCWYRQLVFDHAQSHVQTSVRLKQKTKSSRRKPNQRRRVDETTPKHDLAELVPDPVQLDEYRQLMVAGLVPTIQSIKDKFRVLVIGLGGGSITLHLLHVFHRCHITAVELDSAVVDVATKWFGLGQAEHQSRLKIHTGDGLEFVRNFDRAKSEGPGEKHLFDVVLLDANTNDMSKSLVCPAEGFVENEFLEVLSRCITDKGVLMINVLSRSPGTKDAVVDRIRVFFPDIYRRKCVEAVNEVLYCFKSASDEKRSMVADWISKARSWESAWKSSHNEELHLSEVFENVVKVS